MTTLSADRVSVKRQGRLVLRDINLQSHAGRVLALVGPNGAGKSTLLGVLAGQFPPASGRVAFHDRALARWHPRQLACRRAMLSQRVDLDFGFTVDEVVALGRSPHPPHAEKDAVILEAALRAAHAWPLRGRDYTALSGGEKQRVQLARVLAQVWDAPPAGNWLLLDEPEAGLDIAHQHFILQRARGLACRGFGVIVVLHDLNLAARYADDIAVLAAGILVRHGPPEIALDPALLSTLYGIPLARRGGLIDAA